VELEACGTRFFVFPLRGRARSGFCTSGYQLAHLLRLRSGHGVLVYGCCQILLPPRGCGPGCVDHQRIYEQGQKNGDDNGAAVPQQHAQLIGEDHSYDLPVHP
jgi:hypothetical protein